jgi:hypothetical protein
MGKTNETTGAIKNMNTTILNTNGVPETEQLFGWWNVTIESVSERLSQNSGQNKLLVRFIINDESAKGKVIIGHIPLADFPRARALVRAFKRALCLPVEQQLPDKSLLLGRQLRICNSPWIGRDGVTRESVTAFDVVKNETVAVAAIDEAPPYDGEIPF